MIPYLAPRDRGSTCSISAHNRFGPIVDEECYNGLDFTLLFEEGFMRIAPALIGIVWMTSRIWSLRTQKVTVTRRWLYWTKMVGLRF